jgi:hypothetical protein
MSSTPERTRLQFEIADIDRKLKECTKPIGWRTDAPTPATVASNDNGAANVSQPTESVFRETSSVKQSTPITVNVQKDDDIWKIIHQALNQPKRLAA